jgi:hypothetical protein
MESNGCGFALAGLWNFKFGSANFDYYMYWGYAVLEIGDWVSFWEIDFNSIRSYNIRDCNILAFRACWVSVDDQCIVVSGPICIKGCIWVTIRGFEIEGHEARVIVWGSGVFY